MSLPMSCYQELLARVRSINEETKQLNAHINSPLPSRHDAGYLMSRSSSNDYKNLPLLHPSNMSMQSASNESSSNVDNWRDKLTNPHQANKPDFVMWNSVEPAVNRSNNSTSFKSDDGLTSRSYSEQQLGVKVDMVYGLIGMLENHNRDEMTKTLLAMSHSPDSCMAMRQSGCIPLLVQLIHSEDEDCSTEIRQRAAQALHNLIHCHADDKQARREVRVLRLLEKTRTYGETMSEATQHSEEEEIGEVLSALMKLSFDEDHRHAMCQLGALYSLAKLIQMDTQYHGGANKYCIVLRRYAAMTLTNLTFGHGNNKITLCCLINFMKALVMQLSTPSENLRQVTASVLRNLSWRADARSKEILREVNAVPALMKAAMEATKESTLKSILSALWNFSAHCNNNKVDICNVEGALPYLIEKMKCSSQTSMTIVENAGGVMRNISSHIAVKENYRAILREQQCLQLLLEQLRSPSLTVVSNACGTLWNLSAHCTEDQMTLWSLGAVPMLKSLIHSRHKMISMGASAALKNLLAAKPDCDLFDKGSRGMPSLLIRKRRALEKELDANLSETCDNIENSDLPSPITPQSTPQSVFNSHHPQMISSSHQHLPPSTPQRHNSEDKEDTRDEAHNVSREETNDVRPEPIGVSSSSSTSLTPATSYANNKNNNTSPDSPTFNDDHQHNDNDLNNEEDEEEQLEHQSYSKIEESYNIGEEDDDTNEPNYLDQPTNYSLRYTEKPKVVSTTATERNNFQEEEEEEGHGDCLKTFCTEDTPYNFSNSTSLSDLRITDGGDNSACKTPEDSKPSSGRMSPQKLAAPFDETPLMFSRCSSLGSLSSCDQQDQVEATDDRSSVAPEDRFSVVSDFSRMTSGMISPSELPDSPIQTAPGSPSHRANSSTLKFTYPNTPQQNSSPKPNNGSNGTRSFFEDTVATYKNDDEEERKSVNISGGDDLLSRHGGKLPPLPTSAKDELKCYAVEESPSNISAWSSLSDLTINTNTSVSKHNDEEPVVRADQDVGEDNAKKVKLVVANEDEEEMINDEDILQECIMVGIESAKNLTLKKKTKPEPVPKRDSSEERKSPPSEENNNEDDILASVVQLGMQNVQKSASSKPVQNTDSTKSREAIEPRSTTPNAILSTAAHGASIKIELSDEEILQQCIMEGMSGCCQATDENVLQQCIKAGMEKFKQEIQHKKSTKRIHSSTGDKNINISSTNLNHNQMEQINSRLVTLNLSDPTNNQNENIIDNRTSGGDIQSGSKPEPRPVDSKDKYFDLDEWGSNDITEEESNLLLEQCIEAGIPYKSKNVLEPSVSNSQQPPEENIVTTTMTGGSSNQTNQGDESCGQVEPNNELKDQSELSDTINGAKDSKEIYQIRNKSINNLIKMEMSSSMNRSMNSSMNRSMNSSMKESWKLDDNLNDDLMEGIMISSKCDFELMKDSTNTWSEDTSSFPDISLSPPSCMKQNRFNYNKIESEETKLNDLNQHKAKPNHQQTTPNQESNKHFEQQNNQINQYRNNIESTRCTLEHNLVNKDIEPSVENINKINETRHQAPLNIIDTIKEKYKHLNEKKSSMTSLDSELRSLSTNESSPDSCLSSPVRKSIAKVNPFPETAKIISNCKQFETGNDNLIKDMSDQTKLNDPFIMNSDELKYSSLIELDCGKLGIISSIDFEDLNSVKPPSMMESLTCLDKSMYNKSLLGSMQSSVNLDSIKPPSFFDEVNHILDMDSSICNIDSIVSEIADTGEEDVTLIDDEIPLDLPEDNECKLQRKVTPKQKRNLSKERFNTYTIKSEKEKMTPKQKRQQDRDRYSTRTIIDDDVTIVNHDTFVVTEDCDSSTLMSGNVSEIEDFEMDDDEPICESTYTRNQTNSPSPPSGPEIKSSPKVSKLEKPKSLKAPQHKSGIPVSNIPEPKQPPIKSSSTTSTVVTKNSLSTFKSLVPLQRQGTFTKEEPTTPISNIPVLSSFSCQTTPKKTSTLAGGGKPSSTYSVKLRNNSQPNIKRNVAGGVRSSLSNNSLKGELSKDSKLNNSTPSLNRRSYVDLSTSNRNVPEARLARRSTNNSNSSLNSVKSTSTSGSSIKSTLAMTTPQPTKQVTSKIANLWKKVEDTKKKTDLNKKDKRIWISGDK